MNQIHKETAMDVVKRGQTTRWTTMLLRIAILRLAVIVGIASLSGTVGANDIPPRTDPALLQIGQTAPAFEVPDPSGENSYSLDRLLRGNKAAIIYFWCHA